MNFKVFKNPLYKKYFFAYFLITGGAFLIILAFGNTIYSEYKFYSDKLTRTNYVLQDEIASDPTNNKEESIDNFLKSLIDGQTVKIKPPTPNSIVIEKIGVSAPIIKNVTVVNEDEYFEALKNGVAHAQGKPLPGEVGNVYLFAHSSIEFWKMGPYATVFNQLRRLENGDIIHTYNNGVRYDYEVFNKQVVSGFDLTPFNANYTTSVLTLQTCDPPGTQLNRLIVTARLIN